MTTLFPAQIEQLPSEFLVRFRDVPEALTGGASLAEALANAPDALAVALAGYLEAARPLPQPSRAQAGDTAIALDPEIEARAP